MPFGTGAAPHRRYRSQLARDELRVLPCRPPSAFFTPSMVFQTVFESLDQLGMDIGALVGVTDRSGAITRGHQKDSRRSTKIKQTFILESLTVSYRYTSL